jgi:folate-binding protein YgfZ
MVTNDVKQVADSRSVECFVVDVKGKVLSHGYIFEIAEALYFVSFGSEQAQRLLTHWDRYIIREDVVLADVSSLWNWHFRIQSELKTIPNSKSEMNPTEAKRGSVVLLSDSSEHDDLQVAITNDMIGGDYCLVGTSSSQLQTLEDITPKESASESSLSVFHSKRIEHHLPLIGIDFDDKNLPQELDRDSKAISFKKGCYLGQETIARLDALGQVQKKLVRLHLEIKGSGEVAPAVGDKLFVAEKESGWLTSVSRVAPNNWIALGYVRRNAFAIGSTLTANGFTAQVV